MAKYFFGSIALGHHKVPLLSSKKIGVFSSGFGKVIGGVTARGAKYSCAFGIKWNLARPKVFGIGLGKTGTTTLGNCLDQLGFHHEPFSNDLLQAYQKDDYQSIFRSIANHDSFEDFPWPFLYRKLAEKFPSSYFILTTRKDPEVWYESLKKHFIRAGMPKYPNNPLEISYKKMDILKQKDQLIQYYNDHNREVREFFAERSYKFLEVCWENGDEWKKLCNFLDLDIPDSAFPHSNAGIASA